MGKMDSFGARTAPETKDTGNAFGNVPSAWQLSPETPPAGPDTMPDEEVLEIARQLDAAFDEIARTEPLESGRPIESFIRIEPQALPTREHGTESPNVAPEIAKTFSMLEAAANGSNSPDPAPERVRQTIATASGQATAPARVGSADRLPSAHLPRLLPALIAAAAALLVGSGLGYVMSSRDTLRPEAKIQSTAQGGAQLRLDYELSPR